MGFELTKIKAKRGGKVEIWWDEGGDEKYVGSLQRARPELCKRMESLKTYVERYLSIPGEWLVDIDITGVTMGQGKEGRMATVTALRTLDNGKVFVINTPHDDISGYQEWFEDLEAEAKLFTQLKRAQGDLFEKDDEKGEAPEPLGEDRQLPEMGSGTGWWELLECEHDASLEEIKKAFRIKAHTAHPDKPGNNEEDWNTLVEAFK